MGHDHQSYRLATQAAVTGLVVQLLLAVGAAVAGLASQSPALHVVTWHLVGGLPIWIVLAIMFNQHRLERLESLEAEQMARADSQTAALFEEHAADLQIARRRLDNLTKWGLPVLSAFTAIYLATVGGVFFFLAQKHHQAGTLIAAAMNVEMSNNAMGIFVFVSLAISFVAFISARYVAGMTQHKEWTLLRGGASFLMGNCLAALVIAIGFGFALFGDKRVLAYSSLAVPAAVIAQAFEVLVTFTLTVYRPRRAGEIQRPAFDSRLLGFLTSPQSLAKALADAINYQFGFEVSRSWFYRLLGRAVVPLALFGAFVLWIASSFIVVQPYEEAVITRFGQLVWYDQANGKLGFPPGPHVKLPWPLGRADLYPVGRVREISIGSAKKGLKEETAILWTNVHFEGGENEKEEYFVTAPTLLPGSGATADAKTPGSGLVGLQAVIQYRIDDLHKYASAAEDPEKTLRYIAERRLATLLATHDIDTILGSARKTIVMDVQTQTQKDIDAVQAADREGAPGLGIKLLFVGLGAVHPPRDMEVAVTFHAQIGALQEKASEIEKAEKVAIETLARMTGSREQSLAISKTIMDFNEAQGRNDAAKVAQLETQIENQLATARGEAAQVILSARAYRWERELTEQGNAERFSSELAAYRQSPRLYRDRAYLEVLAASLATPRKYILAVKQAEPVLMRIDMKEPTSLVGSTMELK